jgi:hypothetical protein
MGGACGMYVGQERCVQGFWWRDLMETDYMEGLGVDGKIILKLIFKKWDGEHGLD